MVRCRMSACRSTGLLSASTGAPTAAPITWRREPAAVRAFLFTARGGHILQHDAVNGGVPSNRFIAAVQFMHTSRAVLAERPRWRPIPDLVSARHP